MSCQCCAAWVVTNTWQLSECVAAATQVAASTRMLLQEAALSRYTMHLHPWHLHLRLRWMLAADRAVYCILEERALAAAAKP